MSAPATKPLDFGEILGQFAEARSFLTVATKQLEDDDNDAVSDEAACLRHGLELLNAAYNNLDVAISAHDNKQRADAKPEKH